MINFLLAIHCHQPVGNFTEVFEEAYNKAYLPFIECLERHPKIVVSLHYSGSLLDFFEEKHPEILKKIKTLVKRKQIEILCGGYFEPILPVIPEYDAKGQILLLKEKIRQLFSFDSKGLWLTERVWEPNLPGLLDESEIDFTIVDDLHFKMAGVDAKELEGFYISEDKGRTLAIFPSPEALRYSIPFKDVDKTFSYFKSRIRDDRTVTLTYGDDGEKFGLWPKTYKWVYEDGWLERFFTCLEENQSWIRTSSFSDILKNNQPKGRIYLPCASYREMIEWSGGFFRNFFSRYLESNNMHKKMLYISDKIHSIKNKSAKLDKARRYLYKAQNNDAYWHGVFGGLYLHHLRSSVYANLIEAEKILKIDGIETKDFNCDGKDEVLLSSKNTFIYFSPKEGAGMFEWDLLGKNINLVNTLMRRPEIYHEKLKTQSEKHDIKADDVKSIHDIIETKEKNLESFLIYDKLPRYCLLDHFLKTDTTLDDFALSRYKEEGNFLNDYSFSSGRLKESNAVQFSKNGRVNQQNVKLTKRIEINKTGLNIAYRIRNLSSSSLSSLFGTEFNLSSVYDKRLARKDVLIKQSNFSLQDSWNNSKIDFKFNTEIDIWHYPVETVSISEGGIEKNYQCVCLLFNCKLDLAPESEWKLNINIEIA